MNLSFRKLVAALIIALSPVFAGFSAVYAAGDAPPPPEHEWSFNGMFGTFDRAMLQRGFKVYEEVCAGCHSLKYIHFRNLTEIGFTAEEAEVIASRAVVSGGVDDAGDPVERAGRLADPLPSPFANDQAARAANGGALPPDLSLVTKNRNHGPNYILALLTGYTDPPEGYEMTPGMSYNKWFPGHQIAMAAPLAEDAVEYPDKTPATVEQMAEDVTHFLHWAANPELEVRHGLGLQVLIFLGLLTVLFWFVQKAVWRNVDH